MFITYKTALHSKYQRYQMKNVTKKKLVGKNNLVLCLFIILQLNRKYAILVVDIIENIISYICYKCFYI